MIEWNRRPVEVKYLFNPAFCGRILFAAIKEYGSMPFPIVYLVLPLILHKKTRQNIKTSRTKFHEWTHEHDELLIGFSQRARGMVEITNEAIELLVQTGLLQISNSGELFCSVDAKLSESRFADQEIKECISKSKILGHWFYSAGSTEAIYISLGVKP